MLNLNRKVVTWSLITVFTILAATILSNEYYQVHAKNGELEEEKDKLDKKVTDLMDEKEAVESDLENKELELEEQEEVTSKAKKETKNIKKKKEELEEVVEEKDRVIKNKDDEINKLKNSTAKKEDKNRENEKTTTASNKSSSSESVKDSNTESGNIYNMDATHYSAFCNTGCTGKTATGIDVSNTIYHQGKRVVAVDPNQIPLGSTVKVTGGGHNFEAVAADTGGDIGSGRIDILVESTEEAYQLGRKNVQVEVLN